MEILEKLKLGGEGVSLPLPSPGDVTNAERQLGITLPPSYVKYQLEYSGYAYGTFEPCSLFEEDGDSHLVRAVEEARENGLPAHMIPFLEDNGDYYCFDLSTTPPEYEVRYWSHNGTADEKWDNFLDWVQRCWIDEHNE